MLKWRMILCPHQLAPWEAMSPESRRGKGAGHATTEWHS